MVSKSQFQRAQLSALNVAAGHFEAASDANRGHVIIEVPIDLDIADELIRSGMRHNYVLVKSMVTPALPQDLVVFDFALRGLADQRTILDDALGAAGGPMAAKHKLSLDPILYASPLVPTAAPVFRPRQSNGRVSGTNTLRFIAQHKAALVALLLLAFIIVGSFA